MCPHFFYHSVWVIHLNLSLNGSSSVTLIMCHGRSMNNLTHMNLGRRYCGTLPAVSRTHMPCSWVPRNQVCSNPIAQRALFSAVLQSSLVCPSGSPGQHPTACYTVAGSTWVSGTALAATTLATGAFFLSVMRDSSQVPHYHCYTLAASCHLCIQCSGLQGHVVVDYCLCTVHVLSHVDCIPWTLLWSEHGWLKMRILQSSQSSCFFRISFKINRIHGLT